MEDKDLDRVPWWAWDDSLDGVSEDPAEVADERGAELPVEARAWLVEQRLLHGLLRAAHSDADGREARIRRILAALPAEPGGRRWWWRTAGLVAAAAIAVGLWLGWTCFRGEPPLPEAQAMVARAADRLRMAVDREFAVRFEANGRGPGGSAVRDARVVMRPGRLLVEGEGPFGEYRLGFDGEEYWVQADPMPVFTLPPQQMERLSAAVGGVIDLGYLDLQQLLETMPADFQLVTAGRERHADGSSRVRVVARALPERMQDRVQRAELWFEEASGMVVEIHLLVEPREGYERSLTVEYRGDLQLSADTYRVPQ